jgi:hypothetical protein
MVMPMICGVPFAQFVMIAMHPMLLRLMLMRRPGCAAPMKPN